MELKLEQGEVREILLAWAEKEMPGRFNTVVFSSYGKDVTFEFLKPKLEIEQVEKKE